MPDRLQELLHQRELVHEQLMWLDREIATAQGIPPLPDRPALATRSSEAKPPAPPMSTAAALTPGHARAPALNEEAEKILGSYQENALSTARHARRAVWLMFFLGLALIGLGYFLYGRRLGRWW